jgi:hydroxyacylglutathione hydrolase
MKDLQIEVIETSSLGDRSYLATDRAVAVVVDPQRDIDRILELVARRGVRLTHVLETHIHNDYVTGGLELAQRTGATYVVAAGDEVDFDRLAVRDGDVVTTGGLRLRVLHTPGHTLHHVSYALQGDTDADIRAVFTGGSMLFGATGRTDLVGPEHTDALTHAQFDSVRRLAEEIPGSAEVFPTHGFGSFCSATPTSGDASTVAEQRSTNPALTLAEQEYVDTLLAGLDAYPAYYAHMGSINRRGPQPVDLSLPEPIDADQLRARLAAGEWVVDLRERTAFAAGHLPGTLAFELSTNFVTYLGWLYRYGTPLTLVGETDEQVATARRELVRIGIDALSGAATGEITSLAGGQSLRSYPVSDFAGLAAARKERTVRVIDTRRNDERAGGGVADSLHIPLHELADRLDEVPAGEVWVYCGSGYRASIAASVLDRHHHSVVLINDTYRNAGRAALDQPS